MRISVRGWGRDQGETQVMKASLSNAEKGDVSRYARGETYLEVYPHRAPYMTAARISTSTALRLGGNYLLHVELSREDIEQLFFETHSGDIVRMFRSFMAEETRQYYATQIQRMTEMQERRRQRLAGKEQEEPAPGTTGEA